MLCDDSRYPGYFTRLAEKHLNSLLLNRLCAYVRFTDCYLLKTRQNKTECHNSFNNKYLTLCVLCALCGFEKSGLNKYETEG